MAFADDLRAKMRDQPEKKIMATKKVVDVISKAYFNQFLSACSSSAAKGKRHVKIVVFFPFENRGWVSHQLSNELYCLYPNIHPESGFDGLHSFLYEKRHRLMIKEALEQACSKENFSHYGVRIRLYDGQIEMQASW